MVRILFFSSVLLLISGQIHAAYVKYVVEGSLDLYTFRDLYLETDVYDLDGANYRREYVVDASLSPNYFSGDVTGWDGLTGFAVIDSYFISNRPNGADDLFISISPPSNRLLIQNPGPGFPDGILLSSTQLSGPLADLSAQGEFIFFDGDVIPGTGYIDQVFYPFSNSDVSNIRANVWNYAPGGRSGTIEGKSLAYKQSFGSAYATTVVPIPATAWLFASALGVFGYLGKRKTAA